MTAVGDVIKHELLANLKIAQETMKDMTKILDELNLTGVQTATMLLTQRSLSLPKISLANDNLRINPISSKSVNTTSIQFNAPLVTVNGNVSDTYELDRFVREAENRITTNILKYIR